MSLSNTINKSKNGDILFDVAMDDGQLVLLEQNLFINREEKINRYTDMKNELIYAGGRRGLSKKEIKERVNLIDEYIQRQKNSYIPMAGSVASNIAWGLSDMASVSFTGVPVSTVYTGGSKLIGAGKGLLRDTCVNGVIEKVAETLYEDDKEKQDKFKTKTFPTIEVIARYAFGNPQYKEGYDQLPIDEQNRYWYEYIDNFVMEFEKASQTSIDQPFKREDVLTSFKNITGQDPSFLRTREGIIEMLKKTKSFQGLAEAFLKFPITNFKDHSLTITDRFDNFLPEWLKEMGLTNYGITILGNTETQQVMNMKQLRVLGFVLYEPQTEYKPAELSQNPFEKFNVEFQGIDKQNNPYKYNYYGPNNPLPNGKPINAVDWVGYYHDYSYLKYGYNSEGAKMADRILVEQLQYLIDNKIIDENSPANQYELAKNGIAYFGSVVQK